MGPWAAQSPVGKCQCPHLGPTQEILSPRLFAKVCDLGKEPTLSSCKNKDCASTLFVDEASTRQST